MKRYLAVLLLSTSCFAAPFCLVTGGMKSCIYSSASQCRQVAVTMDGMCIANDDDDDGERKRPLIINNKNEQLLNNMEKFGEAVQQARQQSEIEKDRDQSRLQQEVEHQMRYDNDSLYRSAYDKVMARKAAENAPKSEPAKRAPQPSYSSGAIFAVIVIFAGVAAASMIATN